MNKKLDAILTWANYNGISLDNASIYLTPYTWEEPKADLAVIFDQAKESRSQFQAVKRAIGGFPEIKEPGKSKPTLVKVVDAGRSGLTLRVTWEGAFECKVSYSCTPAKFEGDPKSPTVPSELRSSEEID